jgi:hypothetical protein
MSMARGNRSKRLRNRRWYYFAAFNTAIIVIVYLEQGTEGLRAQLGSYASLPLALVVTWSGCAAVALVEAALSRYRNGVLSYMVVQAVALLPMWFLLSLLTGLTLRDPLFYGVLVAVTVFTGGLIGVNEYARDHSA